MSSQKPIKPIYIYVYTYLYTPDPYANFSYMCIGFPGGLLVKNSPASAGNASSIHESGSSPGEGNGNPLQHPCLGNPMDPGTCHATVHAVAKSWTPRLSE